MGINRKRNVTGCHDAGIRMNQSISCSASSMYRSSLVLLALLLEKRGKDHGSEKE